jgi:hypothetical protein
MLKHFGFRISLLAAAFGVMAWVGSARAQNLLANPDLDIASISTQVLPTPTGWVATASRSVTGPFNDGMSSESFANVLQPNGLGLFFKPFQGDTTGTNGKLTASLYQDNPATAGLPYTLKGWAGAGPGYVGLSDPTVKSEFHIDFLNAASIVIGGATLDLRAAGLGSGAPTPPATGFGYHMYSLSALAPAGTTTVRSRVQMTDAYANPNGGDQAFVVDSFSLTVPEPASLSVIGLAGLSLLARRRTA